MMILFLTRLTPKKLMPVGVNQKYKKMKHVNYFTVLFYITPSSRLGWDCNEAAGKVDPGWENGIASLRSQ